MVKSKHKGRRKQGRKKRKGKKMPKAVLEYFKLRNQGLSKVQARKRAGL